MTQSTNQNPYLNTAEDAAHAAGGLLRAHFDRTLQVDESTAHDIKLQLDKQSQHLIESILLAQFPDHAIYGEEGIRGANGSPFEWIVDPIDGTVNYFFGIPHVAISIALREKTPTGSQYLVGVIYDPFRDELWSCQKGHPPLLNGHPIHVSSRPQLKDAAISVGVSKTVEGIKRGIPLFERYLREAKKCRMMGSASLDIAYVACGRLDAYIESQISLWDVAAGILLVESAGGTVQLTPLPNKPEKYAIIASSGLLDLGVDFTENT